MNKYKVKINEQIYEIELEKDRMKSQNNESTESSADICFDAIKVEYDYCVTRAEKLENKIYILLAACAFEFVLLTTQIEKAGKIKIPQSNVEFLLVITYVILLIASIVSNVGMAVNLLKSVMFERLDAGLILTTGLPDEKETTVVRFIGRLYVQHTERNNAVLEKGYTVFNKCVNLFCVSVVTLIVLAIISIFLGI